MVVFFITFDKLKYVCADKFKFENPISKPTLLAQAHLAVTEKFVVNCTKML